MEFQFLITLYDLLKRDDVMSSQKTWESLSKSLPDLCNRAHSAGLIHGDLHDGNIGILKASGNMLGDIAQVRMIDFGRSLHVGQITGGKVVKIHGQDSILRNRQQVIIFLQAFDILWLTKAILMNVNSSTTSFSRSSRIQLAQELCQATQLNNKFDSLHWEGNSPYVNIVFELQRLGLKLFNANINANQITDLDLQDALRLIDGLLQLQLLILRVVYENYFENFETVEITGA
jgi:hypothetical protein